MFNIKLHGITYKKCYCLRANYENGNTAIEIFGDGGAGYTEPIIRATYNLGTRLPPDEIILNCDKDNDEDLLQALKTLNIIKEIVSWEKAGFKTVPKCKIDEIELNNVCIA